MIATVDDLITVGYSKAGVYKAKERGIISDEKCERLLEILGDKARPVVVDALKIFAIALGCRVVC